MNCLELKTLTTKNKITELLNHFLVALYQEFNYEKAYQYFSKPDQQMNSLQDYVSEMEHKFWALNVEKPIFYKIIKLELLDNAAKAEIELNYNTGQNIKFITLGLIDEEHNGTWAILYNWKEDERRKRIWPGPK